MLPSAEMVISLKFPKGLSDAQIVENMASLLDLFTAMQELAEILDYTLFFNEGDPEPETSQLLKIKNCLYAPGLYETDTDSVEVTFDENNIPLSIVINSARVLQTETVAKVKSLSQENLAPFFAEFPFPILLFFAHPSLN